MRRREREGGKEGGKVGRREGTSFCSESWLQIHLLSGIFVKSQVNIILPRLQMRGSQSQRGR